MLSLMLNKISLSLIILLFSSCSFQKDKKLEEVEIDPINIFSQIDNGGFLHEINDIKINEDDRNEIFLINQGRVIKIDSNFIQYSEIGVYGEGPKEISFPSKIELNESGVYITDASQLKLLKFNNNGQFDKEWRLTDRYFAISDFSVEISDSNSSQVKISFNSPIEGIINSFIANDSLTFGEEIKNPKPNSVAEDFYSILNNEKNYFAIPHSRKSFYVFDLNGKLENEVELPNDLFIERLKYKEEQIKKNVNNLNSTFKLISDAYYNQGNLYLLISQNEGENFDYYCNRVLVIDTKNDFALKGIFKLDGEVFNQIAIADNVLYTFDEVFSTIHKYILPK